MHAPSQQVPLFPLDRLHATPLLPMPQVTFAWH